jgi:hypothetical protein
LRLFGCESLAIPSARSENHAAAPPERLPKHLQGLDSPVALRIRGSFPINDPFTVTRPPGTVCEFLKFGHPSTPDELRPWRQNKQPDELRIYNGAHAWDAFKAQFPEAVRYVFQTVRRPEFVKGASQ